MAELSPADASQLYMGTVVLYKGIPVYIWDVDGLNLHMKELKTGKKYTHPHSFEDIKSPSRLGFVNVQGSCVYIQRESRRLYTIGINNENLTFHCSEWWRFPKGRALTVDRLQKLSIPELHDTILGVYPSLEESLKNAIANQGMFAFDRQFAVDYTNTVFYKMENVGVVDDGVIKFATGKEYLSLLLDGKYENGFGCISLR